MTTDPMETHPGGRARRKSRRLVLLPLLLAAGLFAAGNARCQNPEGPPDSAANPPTWDRLTGAERMDLLERLVPTLEYTCPMHPTVRAAEVGLCGRCGMPLAPVEPSVRSDFVLELEVSPSPPQAGEVAELRFEVRHPETGEAVREFLTVHEKLYHLFIVSRDLESYQHVHPTPAEDGSFTLEVELPLSGRYGVYSDFSPVGGTPQVIRKELEVAGSGAESRPPELAPDSALSRVVDSLRVRLEPSVEPLVAGQLVELRYTLEDVETGEPVTDLEPYLGAWGHTLILDAGQEYYLHSHPMEMLRTPVDPASRGGPEVGFRVFFPEAGAYRIWTQFQRGGQVSTAVFTVEAGEETRPRESSP